jgi:hypothetical protein
VVLQRLPAPLAQLTAGGCSPLAVNRIRHGIATSSGSPS